ncbi:sulfite exporter TauE/SafE family protein [Sphingomonas hylomeconis]|uniref:Probable membrane transporter protein n=1 Tax=Sphingomonas hylomeconis TaxID=1395958 RepID=A0ABV7T1K4_9SPHN|nr:sulfite exporter TauE/SafE family protein [Sphingomonas hylomeconis]
MTVATTRTLIQYCLGAGAGGVVGFTLALVGGGGSILAVPMMLYVVGVANPHVAIGTSAFAVSVNAATCLAGHVRARTVRWRAGLIYAACGMGGALIGSCIGKLFDGGRLILLFACLMLLVGAMMLRRRHVRTASTDDMPGSRRLLLGFGAGSGTIAGFFGIGGGFLIVPGLISATGMPMVNAVGTSLIAVFAFGLTTASNYAWSGYVDWSLAACFVAGGAVGAAGGIAAARGLSTRGAALERVFAAIIFTVAIAMIAREILR